MSEKRSVEKTYVVRVFATDAAVRGAMQRALEDVGVSSDVFHIAENESAASKSAGDCLLIAPEGSLPEGIFEAVGSAIEVGGFVGVWSDFDGEVGGAVSDEWITTELLRQQGATVSRSLDALALATMLYPAVRSSKASGVSIQGRANGIVRRLRQALAECGAEVVGRHCLRLRVDETGRIFAPDTDAERQLGEPQTVAEGTGIVLNARLERKAPENIEALRPDDVTLIAQPPPRLLSEIASKKLFSAYGMSLPEEQLCQSPSEASRFVASRSGPSVLKLVKPRLSDKEQQGAVLRDISGAAAARRATQRLTSLAASMGPPEALGVLVSKQVDGGVRLWVAMRIHPRFGRLVLVGVGDVPNGPPLSVFKAPASVPDVLRVLRDARIGREDNAAEKLAVAVAQFSSIIHQLSGRICRAEIHPLVAVLSHSDALVLDALAEVGPDENAESWF